MATKAANDMDRFGCFTKALLASNADFGSVTMPVTAVIDAAVTNKSVSFSCTHREARRGFPCAFCCGFKEPK